MPRKKHEISPEVQAVIDEVANDPPEVGVKVTAEEWREDWKAGVDAMKERWKKRTVGTRKDVVKLAIAAEPKFKDKMETALKEERRAKALKKIDTEFWRDMVEVTDATEYSEGALKRGDKFGMRIDEMYELRNYAALRIKAMPEATDPQREKRMLAARKTNLIIGAFMKGVITAAEARTKIDEVTR